MYKRSYINEDPYVNIFDHPGEVMYAENSYPHHNQLVRTHGGMDVFIKTSSNGECQYHYYSAFVWKNMISTLYSFKLLVAFCSFYLYFSVSCPSLKIALKDP